MLLQKHLFFFWTSSHFKFLYFIFSLIPHLPLIQKGGAHSPCLFIFLLGHAPIWPKRGGHVPEMPPPPRSTYGISVRGTVLYRPSVKQKVLHKTIHKNFSRSLKNLENTLKCRELKVLIVLKSVNQRYLR